MEGGVMQSRAHRAIEPFDASVEHLRKYFGLLLAERGRTNLSMKQLNPMNNETEEDR
jgi:hypothetical protein